jgi:hypothetical protein
MKRTLTSVAGLAMVSLLSGCTDGGGDTGAVSIQLLDAVAEGRVDLVAAGAWALGAGEDARWYEIFANQTWALAGTGDAIPIDGLVPAGAYQGIRLAFTSISRDGQPATLTENGFDLPVAFDVHRGEDTVIELGFAWGDALFESQQGLAFRPALNLVRIVHGDEEVLRLDATDIAFSGGKPPVARMRIFDATGLEVFRSDFVADSRTELPVIGNAGNLTFAAAASEALHAGAQVVLHEWDFGDGATAEGVTVHHEYALRGGNYTVRLTVTDSAGNSDSQGILIALRPITERVEEAVSHPFEGTITGVDPLSCGGADAHAAFVPATFAIGASAARIGAVSAELAAVGLGLPVLLPNLALTVLDGAGVAVGESDGLGASESFETTFAVGEAPAAGNWTVEVGACLAVETAYTGSLTVTWVVDPSYDESYLKWIDSYDDGHNHEH